MPQGGFSRDFQRASELRTDAQKRKEENVQLNNNDLFGEDIVGYSI